MTGSLALSVVIVAPYGAASVRRLLQYLAQQTIRDRMEIVLVASSEQALGLDRALVAPFGGHQIVEVGPIAALNVPRVAGIQAARAPIVVLTEDHCFPAADWAESLLRSHDGPWAGVGPTVGLANPQRYRAWANYLLQYGPWIQPTTGGPMTDLPGHNSSYKRELLLGYGARLADYLVADTMLHWDLQRRGHRLYLDANARVYHVYMTNFRPFVAENYYIGRQFAASRATAWNWPVRLAFIVGSPLIPVVRLWRCLRRVWEFGWVGRLIPGVLPSLVTGLVVSAAGEFVGYTFGMGDAAGRTLDLDFRRDRFVSREERETIWADRLVQFAPGLQSPPG